MSIELNTEFIKTVPGILKVAELLMVLIILFIARFGSSGNIIDWGGPNATFLGVGTSVGFSIIIPVIILTYILGATVSTLEFILNFIGGILFISMGASVMKYKHIQIVVGILAIMVGILFLVDFVYLCIKHRSILQ